MSRDVNNKYWDEELETLPRPELEKRQLADLQEIVQFAYDHAPYYKRSFDEAGVKPADIKTLKDLEKFPFINKKTQRDTQGVGSFFGDMIFYPTPMFVSLVTHGLQAVVISIISHNLLKEHPKIASGIGVAIGAVIMVVGYTLGKTFIYSTFEYAMIKLPYEIAQGTVGAVFAMILCWKCEIHTLFNKYLGNGKKE